MDFSYIISISDGDQTFIVAFIQTFESNTVKIIDAMREALHQNKQENLKANAHQLKPSLEMLKLSCLAQCIEINNNPENTTAEIIESIEDQCKEAVSGMKKFFKVG